MTYTLGDAAKATGISKPTLSKAIKSGKISAIKNEDGSFSIDPAELHRVFPAVNRNTEKKPLPLQNETPKETLFPPDELLEKERSERERERKQLQATIDDLRRRLDEEASDRRQSAEEIRRLTLLLTHQPDSAPEVGVEANAGRAGFRLPPWVWLFVGAGLVAVTGAAFAWRHPEFFA